jgi:septal ring factor EnvC (AmiA/AmiB activator)
MVKGLIVCFTLAGTLLLAQKPLTKTELDTARVRLQATIEAVDKKIDRLNQQMQILNDKMDRLGRLVAELEESIIKEESKDLSDACPPLRDSQESAEPTDKSISSQQGEQTKRNPLSLKISQRITP